MSGVRGVDAHLYGTLSGDTGGAVTKLPSLLHPRFGSPALLKDRDIKQAIQYIFESAAMPHWMAA